MSASSFSAYKQIIHISLFSSRHQTYIFIFNPVLHLELL